MKNILIVGAHYDDAELGVGGTAAKLASEGKNVYKLTLTNNVTRSTHLHLDIAYDTSMKESGAACKVLGINEVSEFEPIECCQLFYNTDTMQKIEDVIYKYNIDTIFMHFSDDANQDHIEAAKLCKTAARHCDNLFAYQSNLYVLTKPYYPTYFVDISEFVDKKIEALQQYGDGHNRFNSLFETTIERNKVWGYSNKVKYAEAFLPLKILVR